ncbi:MAG: phosphatidylserine decarboxylase [Hyphomonas sp.]
MSDDLESTKTPWWTLGFDIEGLVAAIGALLVGILLGWLWSPLFWIGFTAMLVALAAARRSKRTPPEIDSAVVAPCDGRVVSIERMEAPTEMRMEADVVTRIRIASSPTSTNKLYAPIAGDVDLAAVEAGETTQFFATKPDMDGLSLAHVVVSRGAHQVGMRLAQGGFGPRLDLDVEVGDSLRLGRAFGTRRLGGWCDLYLPDGPKTMVWEGQSLVGGETILARLSPTNDEDLFDDDVELPALPETVENTEPEEKPAKDADDFAPEDPAQMFARLKEAASKQDGD